MSQPTYLTAGSLMVLEGPQSFFAGDEPTFTVTALGVSSITNDANLVMFVYKGSSDKTSTYTFGSMSSTQNAVTTKTFHNLVGGDVLFVTLQGMCDGKLVTFAAFELRVLKRSGKG